MRNELFTIALELLGLLFRWIARAAGVAALVIIPIATTAPETGDIIKGVSLGAMLIIIALILGIVGELIKN